MSMMKCEICGKKYYSQIEGKEVCKYHFYELYFNTRDKECIKAELRIYLEDFQKNKKLSKQTLELLRKIKKRFPELLEKYHELLNQV